MKRKILYFMPDNPASGKAGNLTRSLKILFYLNEHINEGNEVNFLSVSDWGQWEASDLEKFKQLFPKIRLTLFDRKISKRKPIQRFLFYKLPNLITKLIKGDTVDITNPYFRRKTKKFINSNNFDTIIVSYASWANIVKGIDYKPYLVIDTHDFMTAQSRNKVNKIGRLFQSELNILKKFNEIWTLSIEEKFIYEQFTKSKIIYDPVTFEHKEISNKNEYKYDIIYVASKNPHNIISIKWFLSKVLPLLNNYKVHLIGKIGETISEEYQNVVKHGMVDDIESFYKDARLSICPMLSGTGVKIKVVESLAHNIPVVTNSRGVDGLSNKSNNGCFVCDDENEFAHQINLLMENQVIYEKARQDAYDYIEKNHSLEKEKLFFKKFLNS